MNAYGPRAARSRGFAPTPPKRESCSAGNQNIVSKKAYLAPSNGYVKIMKDTGWASIPFEPDALAPIGTIPLSVPEIRGNEWKYVKECLDTNWVSSAGPFVDRFERTIADRLGVSHAVAVVNGTSALHLALLVAGVERDDEVLMPALTFIAPANAVRYVGAWPVFVDVESAFWQLDVEKVATFLERECTVRNGRLENRASGRRVRAILPVHVLGHPCDV